VHPGFVGALRVLDEFELPYAEAWRMLRPVAVRLGVPRPSYSTVRRICIAERERKRRKKDELDWLLTDLLAGRFPHVYVKHKLMSFGPLPPRFPQAPRAGPRAP
jgi:hypothetical protein